MIIIKSKNEIEAMRKAGKIVAGALELAKNNVCVGISTSQIDNIIKDYILSNNAKPSFLGYNDFPNSSCISVNNEVIHGIPDKRKLKEGDIVSIDVGAYQNGVHADAAETFPVGSISAQAKVLIEVTRQSFYEGIKFAKEGYRLGDIGFAVASFVEKNGFSVVKQFVGHGVGFELHEDPAVPNYGKQNKGVRLLKGMTLAIEPMVNEGLDEVLVLDNKWTIVTKDGKLSSHYEHSIAITEGEPIILTLP